MRIISSSLQSLMASRPVLLLCLAALIAPGCGTGQPSSQQPGETAQASSGPAAPGLASATRQAPASGVVLAQRATIAVADFEGGSVPPDPAAAVWSSALASFLAADLGRSPNVRLVDREHLKDVLKEQRLSMSDLSDRDTRLAMGRIVGARYFIFGTYTIVDGTAALTARLDSVETGQVLESETISGNKDDMRTLSEKLAARFLSPLDRVLAASAAAGDLAPVQSAEAQRDFAQGTACEDKADYQCAMDMYIKALSLDPKFPEARQRLEQASEKAARQ